MAECYESKSNWKYATNVLEAFLRYDPFHAGAEHQLGRIYEKSGRAALARIHYQKAYLLAPRRYANLYAHAKALPIQNPTVDDMMALSLWNKTDLFLTRLNVVLTSSALIDHLTSDNTTPALLKICESNNESLDANPYNIMAARLRSEVYAVLALRHQSVGEAEEMIALYRAALTRKISVSGILCDMARFEGDKKEKAQLLRDAIVLSENPDVEALGELKAICADCVPSRTFAIKAGLSSTNNPKTEAEIISCIESASPVDPKYGGYYAVLGTSTYRHDAERGVLLCRRAIELNPSAWPFYVGYVNALLSSGRVDDALAVAKFVSRHADNTTNEMIQNNLRKWQK